MVRLNKIYTKTGDDGTTALGSGARVKKYNLRVEAYGSVDEANAAIGVLKLHVKQHPKIDDILFRIQNDLFDLGADLCVPDTGEELGYTPLRILPSQVAWLESVIDEYNKPLEQLKSFILPSGSEGATYAHMARTIIRRAERITVELSHLENEPVSDTAIKYLNRLSDLMFVLARVLNDNGLNDVLWVPGQNR